MWNGRGQEESRTKTPGVEFPISSAPSETEGKRVCGSEAGIAKGSSGRGGKKRHASAERSDVSRGGWGDLSHLGPDPAHKTGSVKASDRPCRRRSPQDPVKHHFRVRTDWGDQSDPCDHASISRESPTPARELPVTHRSRRPRAPRPDRRGHKRWKALSRPWQAAPRSRHGRARNRDPGSPD